MDICKKVTRNMAVIIDGKTEKAARGLLSRKGRELIEKHIAGCPKCKEIESQIKQMIKLIQDSCTSIKTPSGLLESTYQKINEL